MNPHADQLQPLPPAHEPAQTPEVPDFTRPHGDYYGDGVDVTLIYSMLEKTPLERLRTLQGFVQAVVRIRRANGIA